MLSEENKREMKLWEEERKKHDLKYPDENVVRYLHKNFVSGRGKRILDFGCGSGRNTLVMADMGFDIFAVDYNETCLDLTREKLSRINYDRVTYIQNIRSDIPIANAYLDVIVAWGALFYFNEKDRNENFKELNRVLKPDGLLLADFRTKDDFMYKKGREIEEDLFILDDSAGNLAGLNYWFCSEGKLRSLYAIHGFEIVNIEKKELIVNNLQTRNSHWHVWARKKREDEYGKIYEKF